MVRRSRSLIGQKEGPPVFRKAAQLSSPRPIGRKACQSGTRLLYRKMVKRSLNDADNHPGDARPERNCRAHPPKFPECRFAEIAASTPKARCARIPRRNSYNLSLLIARRSGSRRARISSSGVHRPPISADRRHKAGPGHPARSLPTIPLSLPRAPTERRLRGQQETAPRRRRAGEIGESQHRSYHGTVTKRTYLSLISSRAIGKLREQNSQSTRIRPSGPAISACSSSGNRATTDRT